jgi:chromosome segregation protein
MRLIRLDIKGFKSFATETVIHFDEDVIGIVGPNGSGKSNIVDAIRWVLGEQKSKELRLDQMSNVIFNGTSKRKSGGLAQVSLTFENTKNLLPTEYNTITISRILYRSGESEYQLNGVNCRLKDITSLFLDTGIGSNSYAIIALGMVDDILNDKDNSRRKMFEQAAGVSKYKHRKKEAINRLNKTNEDLDRVADLLFEIEGNLKTLEKQATRTQKYFSLKNDYKNLSIHLAHFKVVELRDHYKNLKAQINRETDAHSAIEVQINEVEAQIQKAKSANLLEEQHLSSKQKELNELGGNVRSLENDKQILKQQKTYASQLLERANVELAGFKDKLSKLVEEIDAVSISLNQEKRREQEFEILLEESEKLLNERREAHQNIKGGLDQWTQEQEKLEKIIIEAETEKAILGSKISSLEQENIRLEESLVSQNDEETAHQSRLLNIEKQRIEKEKELNFIQDSEEKRKQKIEVSLKEYDRITDQLAASNRRIDAKKNELQLTKSMVENLEGFPDSIKFLNNSWSKKPPLLSDLIYVDEPYRTAIENYLDQYLNYFVVDSIDDAIAGIKLLGQAQKGKANFFILEAFKNFEPITPLFSGEINAIEKIQVSSKYERLFHYLLNGVVLGSNDFPGKEPIEEGVILLSPKGNWMRGKYIIAGGSIGLFEGKKIGRKRSIEILEKAIVKEEQNASELSNQLIAIKSVLEGLKKKENKESKEELLGFLNQLNLDYATTKATLDNADKQRKEKITRIKEVKEEIINLNEKIKILGNKLSISKSKISSLKSEIGKNDSLFKNFSEQLSQASSDFNQNKIAFIQQQNKVSNLQQELNFKEKQVEEIEFSKTKLEKQKELAIEQLSTGNDEEIEIEKKLSLEYTRKSNLEKDLSLAEQQYFKAKSAINEKEESVRSLLRKRQDAQILINQLKEKLSSVQYEISSIAQRVKIEFQTDINDFINVEVPEFQDIEKINVRVNQLKNRLDNYGEINPLAVEAFDEMKDRYDNINQQKEDIIAAQEDLMATIKEIETSATTQFIESFEKARLYFIEVFRSLFTEDDNCDLILTQPDNPLESSIEIIAKPKGKRPQTINQLSGGEKTLTAIALLFALYLLKPAPFCIFDEVDAPLDDANIFKFNKIIKKFSKESQFIIVTHNKLTMAAVDTIYGVYMAEQGISGVSQVDFRDFESSNMGLQSLTS